MAIAAVDEDALIRLAAFDHVRKLAETHVHLTSEELKPGVTYLGERIPLINPQRGIFKPQRMRHLLSIRTVFPKPGGKVWYDDQRDVHRQIFEAEETVDYASMGTDPDAADNRWLREAFEAQVPIIYFLGVAPGRAQAVLPAFIAGWDSKALKARVAFSVQGRDALAPPASAIERRYALRTVQQRLHQASFREAVITAYDGRCALSGLPEPLLLDAAHIVADGDERFGQAMVTNGIPLSIRPSRVLSGMLSLGFFELYDRPWTGLERPGPALSSIVWRRRLPGRRRLLCPLVYNLRSGGQSHLKPPTRSNRSLVSRVAGSHHLWIGHGPETPGKLRG